MLIVILLWVYALVLSYLAGLAGIRFLTWRLKPVNFQFPALPLTCLVGLALISFGLQYFTFFTGIGAFVHLAVVALASIFTITNFRFLGQANQVYLARFSTISKPVFLLFFLTFSITLICATDAPTNYDSGLYHLQAIKWLEQYPVVPGLGNLHGRLAFNSLWFLPSAFFSPAYAGLAPVSIPNSFCYLLTMAFFLSGFIKTTGTRSIPGTLARLLLFGLIGLGIAGNSYSQLSSPGTDLLALLLIPLILVLALDTVEDWERGLSNLTTWVILVLSIFLVLGKLSTLPILFVPFYFLLRAYQPGFARLFLLVSGLTFWSLPYFVRNIILSGYLVYPFPGLDLFNFDWKIPLAEVISEKNWIESWARIPARDQAEVLSLPFGEWAQVWFTNQSVLNKFLLISLVALTVFHLARLLFSYSRKTTVLNSYRPFWYLYLVMYLSVIYWFQTAPDFRFGYGFLISLLILLILPVAKINPAFLSKIRLKPAFLLGLVTWQVLFLALTLVLRPLQDVLTVPYGPEVVALKSSVVREITVYFPATGDQCWNSAIPCTPYYRAGLGLRDGTLSSGFTAYCKASNCIVPPGAQPDIPDTTTWPHYLK